MIPTPDELLREQTIVESALKLAHNLGYQSGLDAAMSIFAPSNEAPSHVANP